MERYAFAALIAVSALALARPAVAESAAPERPIEAALVLEGGGCFRAPSLAARMAKWLKRAALDRRLSLHVRGAPTSDAGVVLSIDRDGKRVGERHFPRFKTTCDEAEEAIALAAALAIDALPAEPPPPRTDDLPPPDRVRAPPPRSYPTFAVAAELVVLLGALPPPVVGVAPGISIGLTPRFDVRVSGLLTTISTLPFDDRGRAELSLLLARTDACAVFPVDRLVMRGCAGIAGGKVLARHPSYDTATDVYLAGFARFDVRFKLNSWFGFMLGLDALGAVNGANVELLTGGRRVGEEGLPPVGVSFALGPELRF